MLKPSAATKARVLFEKVGERRTKVYYYVSKDSAKVGRRSAELVANKRPFRWIVKAVEGC